MSRKRVCQGKGFLVNTMNLGNNEIEEDRETDREWQGQTETERQRNEMK